MAGRLVGSTRTNRLALADRLEPGLASFGADDADLFIGRETVVEPGVVTCCSPSSCSATTSGATRRQARGGILYFRLSRFAITFEGRVSPTNQ